MTDSPAGTRPPLGLVLSSLARADLTVAVKNRRSLALSTLLPVILLLATKSAKATEHLGGALFIIGLAIAYGLAASGILGYALTVARDRDQGVFQRLRVTPTPTWAVMASRLGVQVVANLAISVAVVVIGSRLHGVSPSGRDYAVVLAISLLASAIFLAIGQALVGLTRSAETANAAGRILFGVLYFLGLFGASGTLGGTWESVSRWSPVGVVMRLFAAALHPAAWSASDTAGLFVAFGYILACAFVGIRYFRWEPR